VHLNTELLGLRFAERGMQSASRLRWQARRISSRRGYRGFVMPAYVREQVQSSSLKHSAPVTMNHRRK
jgi:hypothetical protein